MNKELENFAFVQACLHWSFLSLKEISYLNKERTPAEIQLISGPPFVYYRIALQYMFTMEYNKLMEPMKSGFPLNHFASLEKLSSAILKDQGKNFEQHHVKNLTALEQIRKTDFFSKLKTDRDKKFAHMDGDMQNPFSFTSFTDGELKEAFSHLELFASIMDRCTGVYDYSFVFKHTDPRTDNFIRFQADYQKFYFSNNPFFRK